MLKLYNSATNQFVQDLTANVTILFDANYTIVYQPNVAVATHSVVFTVNGQVQQIESILPYSISGDTNSMVNPWTKILKNTPMYITATEYSGPQGTGSVVNSVTANITFSTIPAPNPHLDYQLQITGSLNMSTLKINGNIQFIFNE